MVLWYLELGGGGGWGRLELALRTRRQLNTILDTSPSDLYDGGPGSGRPHWVEYKVVNWAWAAHKATMTKAA